MHPILLDNGGPVILIQSDKHTAYPLRSRPELAFRVWKCGQQKNNYAIVVLLLQCMTLRVFQPISTYPT